MPSIIFGWLTLRFGYFPAAAGFALSHIKYASYHLWFFRYMNKFSPILILNSIQPYQPKLIHSLAFTLSVLCYSHETVWSQRKKWSYYVEIVLISVGIGERCWLSDPFLSLHTIRVLLSQWILSKGESAPSEMGQIAVVAVQPASSNFLQSFTSGSTSIDNVTAGVPLWQMMGTSCSHITDWSVYRGQTCYDISGRGASSYFKILLLMSSNPLTQEGCNLTKRLETLMLHISSPAHSFSKIASCVLNYLP